MRSPARDIEPRAIRRRGPWGALIILSLIVAVVTMHAMSAMVGTHSSLPVMAHSAEMAVQHSGIDASNLGSEQEAVHWSPRSGAGLDGLPSAMCLMVVVTLLVLARPLWRRLARGQIAWSPAGNSEVLAWTRSTRRAPPPCLTTLGISRT